MVQWPALAWESGVSGQENVITAAMAERFPQLYKSTFATPEYNEHVKKLILVLRENGVEELRAKVRMLRSTFSPIPENRHGHLSVNDKKRLAMVEACETLLEGFLNTSPPAVSTLPLSHVTS